MKKLLLAVMFAAAPAAAQEFGAGMFAAGSSALAVVSKTAAQGSQWDCNDYDGSLAELSRSLTEVMKDAPRVSTHDEP